MLCPLSVFVSLLPWQGGTQEAREENRIETPLFVTSLYQSSGIHCQICARPPIISLQFSSTQHIPSICSGELRPEFTKAAAAPEWNFPHPVTRYCAEEISHGTGGKVWPLLVLPPFVSCSPCLSVLWQFSLRCIKIKLSSISEF